MPELPPSEARVLVESLLQRGLDRKAIARALGVSAEAVRSIQRGKTNGATQLAKLKALYSSLSANFPEKFPGGPRADAGIGAVGAGGDAVLPALSQPEAPGFTAHSLPVEADITAPTPEPEPDTPVGERVRGSIRDFLLGKHGATAVIDAAERKQSSKAASAGSLEERQARLVEQVTPILALGVVILGDVLIGNRAYKPVAPSHQEADAIMRPIVRMAARQLEITGQLSENTIDLLASFAALAVYADRAWHTYQLIRDAEGAIPSDNPSTQHPNPNPVAHTANVVGPGGGAAARPHDPALGAGAGGQLRRPAGGLSGPAAGPQGEPGRAGPDERTRQHTALLDSVLAADAVGRRQLGVA